MRRWKTEKKISAGIIDSEGNASTLLDRVRRRAGDRHLGGGKMVVVVAEDEILVLGLVRAAGLALGLGRALAGHGRRGRVSVLGQVRFRVCVRDLYLYLDLDLDLDDFQVDLHGERVVVEVEVLELDRA